MTYQEWLREWLNIFVKPVVKNRTFEHYEMIVQQKIVPRLGEYVMEDLDPNMVQKYVAELLAVYAVNTVNGIISIIKSSLKKAFKIGVTKKEISDYIAQPKVREKEISCFSVAEQKKIEKAVLTSKKDRMFGIILCLYTGLRIGELFALEWSNVDLHKGILLVEKTCRDKWVDGHYQKTLDTPKTATSRRKVPIPKQLLPYLRRMKRNSKGCYVISGKNGKDIAIRSYQKSFERLLIREDIHHKGFHALRHTFATRALECGMDIKTLSEILGHKNAAVTLNRYAHSLLEHKQEMMNKLGKMLV